MPYLLFYRGDREILRFPLTGPDLKIGRHPANDLTLPDGDISRFHATIERRGDGYWIVDQSRNGTFLNGRRMQASPLKDKDNFLIGSWSVVFSGESEGGEKETVVRKGVKPPPAFCGIIGQSEPMKRVFAMIEKVAPTMATVLILGETGSGKELAARAIHELSPRLRGPFVPINCGSISPQLVESELFGHERGAFTGAVGRHAGAFEQARGGILFLDEVGELPLELQPKLLRVLEERRFRRVGGADEIEADVRLVAATHRNLEALTREGKFREDLFFRLFSVPIPLPPLRERPGDVPLLADFFVRSFQSGGAEKRLTPGAIDRLLHYPWRGNVRELKNVMTRSLLFASGDQVGPEEILFLGEGMTTSDGSLHAVERDAILSALRENGWNKKKTAAALGIAKSTLFHKIKEYQIKEKP